MATIRTLVTRALRRLNEIASDETPTAEDASAGLDALNDMIAEWVLSSVNMRCPTWTLDNTFYGFIPPDGIDVGVLDVLADQGTWNASTNTPTLASGSGTQGYFYRVSVAGSTALDDVASWSVNDYAVYDGAEWLKSQPSRAHEGAIVALLAVRLAADYGHEPSPLVLRDADNGWTGLLSRFVLPPKATFDAALINLPSRRFYGYLT